MPIKSIVATLALVAVLSITTESQVQAVNSAKRVVSTTADLGLQRAKYRVLTTGSSVTTIIGSSGATGKDKDTFRVVVRGIVLQDGDCISFSFVGPHGTVDIGSPTFTGTNPCLTLARRKAKGPLGAAPYTYERAKARYNPRRNRLILVATRGRAQANPFNTLIPFGRGSVETANIDIVIHVRSASGDCDVTFTGAFTVRHNVIRRKQVHVYRGRARG